MESYWKGKVTTQKSLVLKSCIILDFHSEYYIPEIENLTFHLPHVYILGENHCAGKLYGMLFIRHNKFDCKCTRPPIYGINFIPLYIGGNQMFHLDGFQQYHINYL